MFRAIGHEYAEVADFGESISIKDGPAEERSTGCDTIKNKPGTDANSGRYRQADPADAIFRMKQLCHDARQELALVVAMTEQVRASGKLTLDQERRLDAVLSQARGIATMLRGAVVTSPADDVDVTVLLGDMAEQMRLVSAAELTCAIETGIRIDCQPQRARRAVLNLLDNAVRAAGFGGRVELRAKRTGADLVIEVEDSGPGFGRARAGLASIGLSVVDDWIAEVGGCMTVTQGTLGGALIRLTLPCAPARVVPIPLQRS